VGGWLLLAVVAFALGRGNLLATGLLFAGSGAACYWLSPRMLGSFAEADDAVQEAWLRLSRSDASGVENLAG